MSLKAFHVVFILASALMAFGIGAWLIKETQDARTTQHLLLIILCFSSGVGLLVYMRLVLKKLKHISYL